jgi:hypothetical protein
MAGGFLFDEKKTVIPLELYFELWRQELLT